MLLLLLALLLTYVYLGETRASADANGRRGVSLQGTKRVRGAAVAVTVAPAPAATAVAGAKPNSRYDAAAANAAKGEWSRGDRRGIGLMWDSRWRRGWGNTNNGGGGNPLSSSSGGKNTGGG